MASQVDEKQPRHFIDFYDPTDVFVSILSPLGLLLNSKDEFCSTNNRFGTFCPGNHTALSLLFMLIGSSTLRGVTFVLLRGKSHCLLGT